MKKFVLILCVLLSSYGFSEIDSQKVVNNYWYFDLGAGPLPILFPIFGFGHRDQIDHHGFNFGARGTTVIEYTAVKLNLDYLYYFVPNFERQNYIGIGLSPAIIWESRYYSHSKITPFISPNLLLGKEYVSDAGGRRFFEADINWPMVFFKHVGSHKHTKPGLVWFPSVILSYGWAF